MIYKLLLGFTISITSALAFANQPLVFTPTGLNVAYADVLKEPVSNTYTKYSYGDSSLQYGLYYPAQTSDSDLVVFIHGGCWLNAFDIEHSKPLASALAQSGFSVWNIEYRRTGDEGGGWPGSFEDIKSSINFIAALKKQRKVSFNRLILMGHSAGGHLALLAASSDLNIVVEQVVGLAAITDVHAYAAGENSCQSATPRFMGGTVAEQTEAYQAATIVGKKLNAKALLLHGSADSIVPLSQAKAIDTKLIELEGAGHFDWIHPGSDAFKVIIKYLNKQ